MSQMIQAIYEQGVFRPVEPVDLPERTRVEFEPRVLQTDADAASLWSSRSLDQLAAEQGVTAVTDLDEISDLWPADDDPDELLEHLQRERAARRSLSREDPGE